MALAGAVAAQQAQQAQAVPQPTWVNPHEAEMADLVKRLSMPAPPPLYSPEQQQARQDWNQGDQSLGMLAMLSGNEGLQNAGGQIFKNALGLATPKISDKGTTDQLRGTFTYSPEFLHERDIAKLDTVRGLYGSAEARHAEQEENRRRDDVRHAEDNQFRASMGQDRIAGQMALLGMYPGMAGGTFPPGLGGMPAPGAVGGGGAGGAAGAPGGAGGGAPGAAPAGPMPAMVDAIGTYKMDPSQAFSRMHPMVKDAVMAAVQAKYPDYDPTTYATKLKAARDFGSGALGNQMRVFHTAGEHLDQLNDAAIALHNGDIQLINKAKNAISAWSGGTAPTNFGAVKDIVAKEVVSAIVMGGGGVSEREEFAKLINGANNLPQLQGVISQFRGLMQAKYDNLLEQRRAAGLPDSTLPKYSSHQGPKVDVGAALQRATQPQPQPQRALPQSVPQPMAAPGRPMLPPGDNAGNASGAW